MVLFAAVPSLLIGAVVYALGRPVRVALLVGVVVFLVVLALMLLFFGTGYTTGVEFTP
jgi:hypothetical protein